MMEDKTPGTNNKKDDTTPNTRDKNRKKTFIPVVNGSVQEKIRRLQRLSSGGGGDECVLGRGTLFLAQM